MIKRKTDLRPQKSGPGRYHWVFFWDVSFWLARPKTSRTKIQIFSPWHRIDIAVGRGCKFIKRRRVLCALSRQRSLIAVGRRPATTGNSRRTRDYRRDVVRDLAPIGSPPSADKKSRTGYLWRNRTNRSRFSAGLLSSYSKSNWTSE